MNSSFRTEDARDAPLENFTAQLTRAAYGVALQHAAAGTWLDLELDLWKALAATVAKWARQPSPAPSAGEAAWRENLLADLTESALSSALRNGIERSVPGLESRLHRRFRVVFQEAQPRELIQ